MSSLVKAMFLLASAGLGASDLAGAHSGPIRVGAVIQRLAAFSNEAVLHFQETRPGNGVFRAQAVMDLGPASSGSTVLIPSTVPIHGPSGVVAAEAKVQMDPSTKRLETRFWTPEGLPAGNYTAALDVVMVYN